MGIPGFNSWFSGSHKQAFVPLKDVTVDHVYVDMNSVLHQALRTGKDWEGFHKCLHRHLNDVLSTMEPRKSVVLAVDGPAPLAKVLTQRSRRKAPKDADRTPKAGSSGVGARRAVAEPLSSNAITPGTRFMADLTLSLVSWVTSRLSSPQWRHLHIEVSDATVAGEGECKVLGRMARPWQHVHPDDTHVIVGDDSDLLLMACLTSRPHVYVASTAHNRSSSSLGPGMQVFSVDALHKLWAAHVLHTSHKAHPDPTLLFFSMKLDLVVLAILSKGDDYLPAMKGVPPLQSVWAAYKQLRGTASGALTSLCSVDPRTREPHLNLLHLLKLLKAAGAAVSSIPAGPAIDTGPGAPALATPRAVVTPPAQLDVPPDREGARSWDPPRGEGTATGEADVSLGEDGGGDAMSAASEAAALSEVNRSEGDGSSSEMEVEEEEEEEEDAASVHLSDTDTGDGNGSGAPDVDRYMRGLLWVLQSYVTGECPDYRFTYDVGTPSVAQLVAWAAERAQQSATVAFASWPVPPPAARQPLLPIACALALLPRQSMTLLPAAAHGLMAPSSPLAELYDTCEECEALKAVELAASREYLPIKVAYEAAVADAARNGAAAQQTVPTESIDALRAKAQAAKQRVRDAGAATRSHRAAAHPYKPFPVEAVEAAAASVPEQALCREERALLRFGRPLVFGPMTGGGASGALATLVPGARRGLPTPPAPFRTPPMPVRGVCSMAVVEDVAGGATLAPDTELAPQLGSLQFLCAPRDFSDPKPRSAQGPARSRRPSGARSVSGRGPGVRPQQPRPAPPQPLVAAPQPLVSRQTPPGAGGRGRGRGVAQADPFPAVGTTPRTSRRGGRAANVPPGAAMPRQPPPQPQEGTQRAEASASHAGWPASHPTSAQGARWAGTASAPAPPSRPTATPYYSPPYTAHPVPHTVAPSMPPAALANDQDAFCSRHVTPQPPAWALPPQAHVWAQPVAPAAHHPHPPWGSRGWAAPAPPPPPPPVSSAMFSAALSRGGASPAPVAALGAAQGTGGSRVGVGPRPLQSAPPGAGPPGAIGTARPQRFRMP